MSNTPDVPYELNDALARAAAGLYPAEAAVRLLVEHGYWLAPLAHAGLVEVSDVDDDPLGPRYARGSAGRVLRIAASLGGGVPVDLSDAVSGLDRTNLGLVLAAISHANGSHEYREFR